MANRDASVLSETIGRQVAIQVTSVDGLSEQRSVVVTPRSGYVLWAPGLNLTASGDEVIVITDTFSTVYGAGDDLDDAIDDYLASLLTTVADLEADEAILGPDLRRELVALRQHVARVG